MRWDDEPRCFEPGCERRVCATHETGRGPVTSILPACARHGDDPDPDDVEGEDVDDAIADVYARVTAIWQARSEGRQLLPEERAVIARETERLAQSLQVLRCAGEIAAPVADPDAPIPYVVAVAP